LIDAVSDGVGANLELMRRSYELWNAGGVDEARERIFAPDIVYYDLPEVADTGTFRGVDEVVTRLRAIMESVGHFQIEARSLEGNGDYTLAAVGFSVVGQGSGAATVAQLFHVARWADGRMRELRAYLDGDQARREYESLSARLA
jgi:ketosteroid isomerase-like protein